MKIEIKNIFRKALLLLLLALFGGQVVYAQGITIKEIGRASCRERV